MLVTRAPLTLITRAPLTFITRDPLTSITRAPLTFNTRALYIHGSAPNCHYPILTFHFILQHLLA